jgi:histidyl-tRNA synthetase
MGVDRLLAALRFLDRVKLRKSTADVLATTFDPKMSDDYIAITFEFRRAGIRTERYFGTDRAGKQIKNADKLEIPVVLLYGHDEKAKNIVTIKDMSVGRAHNSRPGVAISGCRNVQVSSRSLAKVWFPAFRNAVKDLWKQIEKRGPVF